MPRLFLFYFFPCPDPTENTTNLQFSATVPKGEYPARQLFLKVRTGSKVGAGDFPANRHIVGERELQFPLEHYGSFEVEHTPRWKPKKPSLANHSFYAFKCKQDHDYVELEFVRREDAAPLEGPGPEKFTLVFKGEREETRAQIAVVIPNSDDGDAAAVWTLFVVELTLSVCKEEFIIAITTLPHRWDFDVSTGTRGSLRDFKLLDRCDPSWGDLPRHRQKRGNPQRDRFITKTEQKKKLFYGQTEELPDSILILPPLRFISFLTSYAKSKAFGEACCTSFFTTSCTLEVTPYPNCRDWNSRLTEYASLNCGKRF